MRNSSSSSSPGPDTFVSLLTVMFIGFKITGLITWSWWWVLSPLWISLAVALLVIFIVIVIWLKRRFCG